MSSNMSDLYSNSEKAKYFMNWWMEYIFGPRSGPVSSFGEKKNALAEKFRERLIKNRPKIKIRPVDTYYELSEKDFVKNYVLPRKPVLIKGAAKDWPAVKNWTPRYLAKKFPHHKHPMMDPESKGTRYRMASFDEIADVMEAGGKEYVKFSSFMHHEKEVEKDFDLDFVERYKGGLTLPSGKQLFMGGSETNSCVHAALANVSFFQIYGTKRWLLLPEEWTMLINPLVDRQPHFLAQEDLMYPPADLQDHEIFSRFEMQEVNLEPGDFYFNPAFCWHYVENPTPSIAVAFRWVPLRAFVTSPLLTSVILMSHYPPAFVRAFTNPRGNYLARRSP